MDSLTAELEKVAMTIPTPTEEPKNDDPNGQETPNEEPETGGEDQPDDEPDAEQTSQETIEGASPFQPLLAKLGYTGEVKVTNLEDLDKIVDAIVAQNQERYSVLERPDIAQVVEFMKAGGSLEEYVATPQPTNFYQDLSFADDDDAKAEQFLQAQFEAMKMRPSAIKATLTDLKGEGQLITEAREVLAELAAKEKEDNANLEASIKQANDEANAKAEQFLTDLSSAFDKPLNGVSASKELLAEAKVKSLPNKQGEIEVLKITAGFTPEQQAVLNLAALAISSKKEFKYTPAKTAARPTTNVIDQIIGKSSAPATKYGTVDELEAMIGGKR